MAALALIGFGTQVLDKVKSYQLGRVQCPLVAGAEFIVVEAHIW